MLLVVRGSFLSGKAFVRIRLVLPLESRRRRVVIMIIIIMINRFSIALFSALEQTHCAHVACGSE